MPKYKSETIKNASFIQLSDMIVQELPQMAINNNDLYMYNGKYYEELTDHEIGQNVFNFFLEYAPSVWSPSKSKNVIEGIKYHSLIKRVKEFDNYNDLINVNNGIYDFKNKKLLDHSHTYNFTTLVDVDYDTKETDAKFFLETLDGIFRNADGTQDKDTIGNILKIGGYLVYPQNKINKLFLFYGEGSNGKSIIMDHVYKMFFDKKFISALSLNVLSSETSPSRKQLLTSRVNFATEQRSGEAIESDEIKKIISGEDISIRRMYQDTITFRPKCKIMVALNKMFKMKDTSYGIKRRLFLINFPNQFKIKQEYNREKNPEKRRIFLANNEDEVIDNIKKEKTAIFNLFIGALDVLRNDNWAFTETDNAEKILKEYNEESDPTGEWLKESYEMTEDETEPIMLKDLYKDYCLWYDENNHNRNYMVTNRTLAKRVRDLFRIESFPFSGRDPYNVNIVRSGTAFTLKLKNNIPECIKTLN